jgi:ribonuclease HI
MGIILAIECDFDRGWSHLWLESDSKLAVLAFKSCNIIPWQLYNRWLNCMIMIISMNFVVSHVYREGNHVADKLANIGLSLNAFTWWNIAPNVIWSDLARNRDGLPYYRFC